MTADKFRSLHDHLLPNPRRVLGPQSAALVHCAKHGQFYPRAESCPWCLSWAEEQAAKRRVAPAAGKSPGQLEYENAAKYGIRPSWDKVPQHERDQWETIAGMATDTQPEDAQEEMDYDTWANMMAMKQWNDPFCSAYAKTLSARKLVKLMRMISPEAARKFGMFDRDPPADP